MKICTSLKTALAVGLLAVSGASFAQTSSVSVPFTAAVTNVCTLSNPVAGVMVTDATNTNLSTAFSGGSMGSFDLSCSGGTGTFYLNPLVETDALGLLAAVTAAGGSYASQLHLGASQLGQVGAAGWGVGGTYANGTFQVGALVNGAAPLPNGNYAFTVTVDVTAN